jgi:hypothetical protein
MTTKKTVSRPEVVLSPELEKERAAILDLAAKGEDEHWQMGVHFNRIVDGHLAQNSGFKNAREFFDKFVQAIPKSSLMLYGAIARAFPEEVAKKYGVTTLRALMTYEHLTDEKLPKGDPGNFPIAIPQQGGETVEKRFVDCTIAELQAAIRFAESPTHEPVPPEFTQMLDKVRKALQEVPGRNPFIVLTARLDPGEGMRVTIKLPIGHFETLRDALELAFPKSDDQAEADGRAGAPGPKPPKRVIKSASSRSHSSRGDLTHPRHFHRRSRSGAPRR